MTMPQTSANTPTFSQIQADNLLAREAWSANAAHWDARMAEGNRFFTQLLWPAIEQLLAPASDQRLLELACGNGVASRRLAASGAQVLATDFSEALLDLARGRTTQENVTYRRADCTNGPELLALAEPDSLDGALCNMAIMDIADIRPMFSALMTLLRPGAAFVYTMMHPCFNNPAVVQMLETEDREGRLTRTYSVKVSRYLTAYSQLGEAMLGQPVPHPYFHRSLTELMQQAFQAGLILDGLQERAFEPDDTGSPAVAWNSNFSEIPPVLVIRLRKPHFSV